MTIVWFYDKKDIRRSPSVLDGIDLERENRYRREGARFIISVGTKMGLRYDTMATGVVYFHRFYMFHSFKTFPRYITACGCLFLAGKVEETPKKCKDVIKIAKTFLTDAQFAQFGDDPKEEVMTLERILLQTIKFDLQVDHPYGHLLKYAKCLRGDKTKLQRMVQMAWTFINDSLCTTLCLQWEPEVIAIALMYLAGKLSKFEVIDWIGRTPNHSHWWDLYVEGMSLELLEDICHQVLDLYSPPVPDTPQESPPATPPSKSTIKKVHPLLSPSPKLVPSPQSPVPPSKALSSSSATKEPPVGQPIPCIEPGELKRKTSKASKREHSESKAKHSSSSSSSQSKSSSGSPKSKKSSRSSHSKHRSPESIAESKRSTSSKSAASAAVDTSYQTAPLYTTASAMVSVTEAVVSVQSVIPPSANVTYTNQYSNYSDQSYTVPESSAVYYNDNSQASLPATSYASTNMYGSSVQPAPATVQSQILNHPAQMVNPPPPPLPTHSCPIPPAPYSEMYPQPPPIQPKQPPLPQYPPPPPVPTLPPAVGQYIQPPQYNTQTQPPSVIMPNVALPLPTPPTQLNLSQPPPSLLQPPRPDMARLPPPGIRPPVHGAYLTPTGTSNVRNPNVPPPPRLPVPRGHFVPKDKDTYRRDDHYNSDMRSNNRSHYAKDNAVHTSQQYNRERHNQHHYQSDLHYDNTEYEEYDDESYMEYEDEYGEEQYNQSYSHDYGNEMHQSYRPRLPPPNRGPPPHHQMQPRPPLRMSPMRAATGIPPVRVTGRY